MIHKIILNIRILICKIFKSPLFIVKIDNGNITKHSGIVKNSFMADCIEIAKRNNINYAFIFAEKGSYGNPIIHASYEIPKDVLQQLRNTYTFNF
jgi:Protein of unknown function (DUF3634)